MKSPPDATGLEQKIVTLLKHRPMVFLDLRTALDGVPFGDLERMLSSMKRSGILTSGGLPLKWSVVDPKPVSTRPVSTSERKQRNAAILTEYEGAPNGFTVTGLAQKYGLSEASIWNITKSVRARIIQGTSKQQTPGASSLAAARGQDLVPGLRALAEHHREIVDAALALAEMLEEES